MDRADSRLHPQGTREMLTHDYYDLITSTPVWIGKLWGGLRELHRSGTSTQEVLEPDLELNSQHRGILIEHEPTWQHPKMLFSKIGSITTRHVPKWQPSNMEYSMCPFLT